MSRSKPVESYQGKRVPSYTDRLLYRSLSEARRLTWHHASWFFFVSWRGGLLLYRSLSELRCGAEEDRDSNLGLLLRKEPTARTHPPAASHTPPPTAAP